MRYCRRCGGSVLEASVPKRSKVCFVPFLSTPNSWLYKLLEGDIPNFGIYLLMIKRKQGGVMAVVKSLLVGECSVFSPPQSLPQDLSQSPTAPVCLYGTQGSALQLPYSRQAGSLQVAETVALGVDGSPSASCFFLCGKSWLLAPTGTVRT